MSAERGWEAGIRTPMPAFKGLCPTVRRPPNFPYVGVEMSGRWELNPLSSPWQGDILPVNYARDISRL